MALQKGRIYRLTLGDYKSGKGILIENSLQITFDVSLSADNKKTSNSAAVEIYNLSPASRVLLETEYLECRLDVGYEATGYKTIISGNVVSTSTRKNGHDIVTQVVLGEGYVDLNHSRIKAVTPAGKTGEDVVEDIRKQMPGVARGVYKGTNLSSPIIHGYSLSGTPKEMLDRYTKDNNLEWRVTGGALYISDVNGLVETNTKTAPVISPQTGLIDAPFHVSSETDKQKKDKGKKSGVQFKALLNGDIVPGKIVKLESADINGFFRANSIRFTGDYRGNDWYVEVVCSKVEGVELK